MKKRKLVAVGLAFLMAFSNPVTTFAQEIIGVSEEEESQIQEDNQVEESEVEEPESETDGVQVSALEGQDVDDIQDSSVEQEPVEETEEPESQEIIEVAIPLSPIWEDTDDIETFRDTYRVDFELSSAQMADKVELYNVLYSFENAMPGGDYLENQVVVEASDEKEAEEVAKGFEGKLLSFQDGVAVVETEMSTMMAVSLSADQEIRLPAAYPNFLYTTDDAEYESTNQISDFDVETFRKQAEESEREVEQFLQEFRDDKVSLAEAENKDILFEDMTGTGIASSNDPDLDKQWYHQMIDTFNAWKVTKGAGVTVAVIDSGIVAHEEFLQKEVGSVHPVNKVTTSLLKNGWQDNVGHGTHVAGIIGAAAGNGAGGVGIAPDVNILSVKALEYNGKTGTGTSADITAAVKYATQENVDIINMSLGGPSQGAADLLYRKAIDAAIEQGITVIVAAGNESSDISKKENERFPACWDEVITVSSLDRFGDLSTFSNYGKIDVAAPGGTALGENDPRDIYSTSIHYDGYEYMPGTSMACPVVSGVAALIIASGTAKGPQAVESALKNSCINIGNKKNFGTGRVNAAAAVKAVSIYTKDNNFHVAAGKSLKLMAKTSDKSMKPAWSISNQSAGTISNSGVFKAAKNITGKTEVNVTVTCAGKSDTVTVTIYPKAGTITNGGKKSMALQFGSKAKFFVTSDLPCTYKTSNNKVALVDQDGTIYAQSNGKATITATTVGGKKTTVKVKVTGTPYLITDIIAVKDRDRAGANMFAQSLMGQGIVAHPLLAGKSIKFKVVSVWPYNTSSDKKVKWICGDSGKIKNGTFRLDKHIETGRLITVRAVPEKGFGGGVARVAGFQPIQGFNFTDTGKKSAKKTSVTIAAGTGRYVPFDVLYKKGANTKAMNPYPYVESSDSTIAIGECSVSNGQARIAVIGKRAGTCTLTLISMDGAYRKATIDVTVY